MNASLPPLLLLVDDELETLDVYAECFVSAGWRCAKASSGVDGLVQAAALRPDVIVLDLVMPGLDGWEVARRLKADPVTKSVPLVVLTGCGRDDARRRAFNAGADGYVTKPCTAPVLIAAVERQLPYRAAAPE